MGGIAVCYRNELSKCIEEKPEGSNRVAVIKINAVPKPMVVIGVYLPCRGKPSAEPDYSEQIDILVETIHKYKPTCDILIAGDFNASIARVNPTPRDKLFITFLKETKFTTAADQDDTMTYFHPSGKSRTQIDYIIQSNEDLITNYKTLEREALNTSQHDPVSCSIQLEVETLEKANNQNRSELLQPKVNWDRIDKDKYESIVAEMLENLDHRSILSSSVLTMELSNILTTAANHCIKSKPRNVRKNRRWPPEINQACKESKECFGRWKANGRPESPDNQFYRQLKESKKKLRSCQRQHEAIVRKQKYESIMKAHEGDQKTFFKLINQQRKDGTTKTSHIILDGTTLTTTEEIQEGWADYFCQLATTDPGFIMDLDYHNQVELDRMLLEDIYTLEKNEPHINVTETQVKNAISSLKNKKASDSTGLMSEHLKYCGNKMLTEITKLLNLIFNTCVTPDLLRIGIVSPVYKKKGKPLSDPNSYRKITVTSIIGKLAEKLHLNCTEDRVISTQNALQRGFTSGVSQTKAALIVTEIRAEAIDTDQPIYFGFLDAQKAFDNVWHSSMLRRAAQYGINGKQWQTLNDWYRELSSRVKWEGGLSSEFKEQQGVRQGGVWSPTAYKVFINPLLDKFEQHGLGSHIGSIYCGTPTVADDITLASSCPHELQTMLTIQENFASLEQYKINVSKSTVLELCKKNESNHIFTFNNEELKSVDTATHLGITRDNKTKFGTGTVVEDRISTSRRTAYAMLGAGLHGINGLNPMVSIHLIRIYILPRLVYGLDVIRLTTKDMDNISMYFKRLLKQVQHLPDRTSDAGTYLMLGEPPLTAEIHKRILTTFGTICRDYNSIEHQIAQRQLAMKSRNSQSWFTVVQEILDKYMLPSAHDILEAPPGRHTWKALVYRTINQFWEEKLKMEVLTKTTLKYLSTDSLTIGSCHSTWTLAGTDPISVTKSQVKARILLGVYTLQSTKHRFNQYNVSPTCPLCKKDPEDRIHFILYCSALDSIRQPFKVAFYKLVEDNTNIHLDSLDDEDLLKALMNCESINIPSHCLVDCENIARGWCYALHSRRNFLLNDSL